MAHNGSIIPVPGRDLFVQAWYQGGLSVIDFTDSAHPVEIAYFDRGPIDAEDIVLGGYWSAYWYRGRIYGTEIIRGIDVLKLLPSDHLTANEIAAATLAGPDVFNPQQQFPLTWPAEPAVARAYLDQLDGEVPEALAARLGAARDRAEERLGNGAKDAELAGELEAVARELMSGADGAGAKRRTALGGALATLAQRLR